MAGRGLGLIVVLALAAEGAVGATWSRMYASPSSWDQVVWAGPAPLGGGAWLVGSDDSGTRFGDALVLRLDDRGEQVWARVVGGDGREEPAGAVTTSDGGLVACGAITHGFTDRAGWIVKLDAAGDVLWQHELSLAGGFQVTTAFAVTETTDGNLVVAGQSGEIDAPPWYGFACKLDPAGNLTWQRWLGIGTPEFESLRALVPVPGGGIVGVGTATSPSGAGVDAWAVEIDADGVVQWSRTYGGSGEDDAMAVDRAPDGGYFVAGTTQSFTASGRAPWLLRLGADGRTAWLRVFGDLEWGDGQAVLARADGSVVLAGRLDFGDGRATAIDLWLAALDAAGKSLWQRSIASDQGDWAASVEAAGGDLLVGAMSAWGFPEQDHWLLRTDGEGRITDCPQVLTADVATTEPAFDEVDAIVSDSPLRFVLVDPAFTSVEASRTTRVACDACIAGGAPQEPSAGGPGQPPLLVTKAPGRVTLELVTGASAFDLHVDRIGSWYAPSAATGTACAVTAWTPGPGGTATIDLDLPLGSWIVASASNACGVSSSGRDSFLRERRSMGTWETCPLGP